MIHRPLRRLPVRRSFAASGFQEPNGFGCFFGDPGVLEDRIQHCPLTRTLPARDTKLLRAVRTEKIVEPSLLIRLRHPLMAIGGVPAGGIEIIQQHKLLGQAVLVRGNGFPEHGERWISVAFGNVAEHLVIRAVLFDDVDNVLERRVLRGGPWTVPPVRARHTL